LLSHFAKSPSSKLKKNGTVIQENSSYFNIFSHLTEPETDANTGIADVCNASVITKVNHPAFTCGNLVSILQWLGPLDEDTIECPHPGAHHDSGGCGQAKGTWTGCSRGTLSKIL